MERRGKRPEPISEILGKTSEKLKIHDNLRRYALWERWEGLVGSEVATHARPIRWRGSVLVVRAEHPAWIQELGFLKQEMIERIRKAHPNCTLKDIKFETGTLPPPPASKEETCMPMPRELTDDEQEFIGQATAEIEDPELRQAATRAMERSMANLKKRIS